MKKIRCIALMSVALVLASCASFRPMPEKDRTVIGIVETDKDQDELFVASNIWLADTFASAESIIEYSDKEAGIVMGNSSAFWQHSLWGQQLYTYTIRIETKGSRAKMTIVAEKYYPQRWGEVAGNAVPVTPDMWNKGIRGHFERMVEDFRRKLSVDRSNW